MTKLLIDDSPETNGHGKILGGCMVGTHAGDMIGEIALAIEMGADAVDIGKTISPPALGESIGMAGEVAHGFEAFPRAASRPSWPSTAASASTPAVPHQIVFNQRGRRKFSGFAHVSWLKNIANLIIKMC